jgi:ABC-type nitrate/sulfonate/bicarbonate transport system permease component
VEPRFHEVARSPQMSSLLSKIALLSARAFRSADLFAGVILLGATGYVTSVAMSLAEHRLLAWQATQR